MIASSRALLDELTQNIRLPLRGVARAPGFAAAVILTLGLGIGANTSGAPGGSARRCSPALVFLRYSLRRSDCMA